MLIALAKKGQHNATTNPRTRKKTDEVIFLPRVLQVYQSPIVGTLRQLWIEEKREGKKGDGEGERERRKRGQVSNKPRFRSRVPRYA